MSLHVGETLGDYRIVSIIGAGSLGQVFQVEHQITKRREALKVLPDCADKKQTQRFQREIEVQARLDHPNIARAYNALQLEDCLVLVMEFVEGQSLEQILKKGRLPIGTGIDYIRQTLCALRYAHERGVIHRDVTPSNLIVTASGRVKLTDFGVAKSVGDWQLTNGGEFVGSLAYMAPEQLRGHTDPDPRSDIYSTGAVLYEILTGKKPFDYPNRISLMVAQIQRDPVRPSEIEPAISPQLNDIVLRAMAKDPGQRYQTAAEFLTAIGRAEESQAGWPRSVIEKLWTAQVRVAAATLAIFSLAGAGSLGKSATHLPPPAAVRSLEPIPISQTTTPASIRSPAPPALSAEKRVKTQRRPRHVAPPRAEAEEEAQPPRNAAEEASEPVTTQEFVGPRAPRTPESAKKRFWSRLNPFKRKKSD
jgi:serine/threonine-protein kinase